MLKIVAFWTPGNCFECFPILSISFCLIWYFHGKTIDFFIILCYNESKGVQFVQSDGFENSRPKVRLIMLNTMQNFLAGVYAGLLLAILFVHGSSRASTTANLPHSFRSGNSCPSSIR